MVYLDRSIEPLLQRASATFPAVVLTGPRQAGKTTLLKHLFSGTHSYVSLEAPDIRLAAAGDPRGFLALYPPPVIFDEIQHAPELLPYIKDRIDSDRARAGQYIITGSQNLLMLKNVTESLAGRAAILTLMPLSRREVEGKPDSLLPWEGNAILPPRFSFSDLWALLQRGFYPELTARPSVDPNLWQSSYVQTYLERDVRTLRQIGDLTLFQNFVRTLALRSGQLLNLTDVGSNLGISLNTSKQWLSVLEASYQVFILRPFHRNEGKRLVKTPKVYFTDTGILCYLCGIRTPEQAASSAMAGAILETAVVTEILKVRRGVNRDPGLWFWRTSHGVEVDVVIEDESRLIPVEVKSSGTPRPAMAAGLRSFLETYNSSHGFLVHAGDVTLPQAPGIMAIPYGSM